MAVRRKNLAITLCHRIESAVCTEGNGRECRLQVDRYGDLGAKWKKTIHRIGMHQFTISERIKAMSELWSEWEQDAAWFRKNFPFVATEDETDAFCERVAIRMSEGMSETHARFKTVDDLKKLRNAQT
jgi:hypothetical protein